MFQNGISRNTKCAVSNGFAETVTYIDYNDIIVDLIIEVRESIYCSIGLCKMSAYSGWFMARCANKIKG